MLRGDGTLIITRGGYSNDYEGKVSDDYEREGSLMITAH